MILSPQTTVHPQTTILGVEKGPLPQGQPAGFHSYKRATIQGLPVSSLAPKILEAPREVNTPKNKYPFQFNSQITL